jgi:Flp pilus assembly pilin Flp
MDFVVITTWLHAKLGRDERGASLVEYILLVALIVLLVLGAVIFMRGELVDKFNYAGSKVSNTPNP